MPNVMGREFPYTPEGQAAALRYSRAIGMRGGGMMGFRPVGYQEGTGPAGVQPAGMTVRSTMALSPEEETSGAVLNVVRDLWETLPKSKEEIAKYIEKHRPDLEWIATLPGDNFNIVRRVLEEYPRSGPSIPTYIGPEEHRPLIEGVEELRPSGLSIPAPLPPGLPGDEFGSPGFLDKIIPPTQRGEELQLAPPFIEPREPRELPDYMKDPRYKGYFNPDQIDPYFDPNEIEVANGGYVGRGRRGLGGGGIMSLRR